MAWSGAKWGLWVEGNHLMELMHPSPFQRTHAHTRACTHTPLPQQLQWENCPVYAVHHLW